MTRLTEKRFIAPLVLAAATAACLVPFAAKPFHLDDPLFLWSARQIQTHPLDPYGFSVNWDLAPSPFYDTTKNPPLACYYLALAGSILGWSEIALHLAFLLPAGAAVVGSYVLARRFCCRPVLAALAGLLTPVFLVSSTNVMCDTMMLAFWVWAAALWLEGLESGRAGPLAGGALLAGLAALTKYYGICLLLLFLVRAVARLRPAWKASISLLLPAAMLVAYQVATARLYGRGLLLDAAAYATKYHPPGAMALGARALVALAFTGGCVAVALFFAPFLWSRRVLLGGGIAAVVILLTLQFIPRIGEFPARGDGIPPLAALQLAVMGAAGLHVLWLAGSDLNDERTHDALFLFLWIAGTFLFAGFVNWTTNGRSILPMAPAVGILLARRLERPEGGRRAPRRPWLLLIPAALVALAVARADFLMARSARDAASDIARRHDPSRAPLWFEGHWGFQYYMERAGAKAVDFTDARILPGEIVAVPSTNTHLPPLPSDTFKIDEVIELPACGWLATMSNPVGAGFYAAEWGPLPFATGAVPPERVSLYAATAPVKFQ